MMATASTFSPSTAALPTRLAAGVAGGLAGGVVFGLMMQMMGMLSMVAMLVGSESAAVGWLVHLAISTFIGGTYALVLAPWAGRPASGAVLGLGYGAVWWVLGPLLIMPAMMGMGVFMINARAWQSLLGHLMFGVVLGVVYALLYPRLSRG